MIVTHRKDDFRGQILWSTAHRERLVSDLLCKSEVCYFDVTVLGNQQVFGFNIPVRDLVAMQILECKYDFRDVEQRDVVGKALLLP